MWPLDLAAESEVLRIGRHAVERWVASNGVLSLHAAHSLRQTTLLHATQFNDAVVALYPNGSSSAIVLVLESAWMPVVLIDCGEGMRPRSQIEALARHRFSRHYADGLDPVAAWDLRIEHRAGNRHALAYGLPPVLKRALIDAGSATKLQWAAMTPSLAWGRERHQSGLTRSRSSYWMVWPEQDRNLLVRIIAGVVSGLNPGASVVTNGGDARRLVNAEHARLGIPAATDPILMARWGAGPGRGDSDPGIDCVDVGVRPQRRKFFGRSTSALQALTLAGRAP